MMLRARPWLVLVATWLVTVLFGLTPARAVTPRDLLLRLVPDDVGFCLVVEDLRGQTAAFTASPFWNALKFSSLGIRLATSVDTKQLLALDRALQQHFHTSWSALRDDLLGDAVVLAYRPGPPSQPEREQGVLLLHARDAKMLTERFDQFNQTQLASGDLKELQERSHRGVAYYRRVENRGDNFVWVHDAVLVVAPKEEILLQIIELHAKPPVDEAPLVKHFHRLGLDAALLQLWVNPRAFEADLRRKAASADRHDAEALKRLTTYWQALDGLGIAATPTAEAVEVRLSLAGTAELLPTAIRTAFTADTTPSVLWSQIPDTALLATAGRFDAGVQLELLKELLPDKGRQDLVRLLDRVLGAALGKDVAANLLPNLGPDWGVCVLAPSPSSKGWLPDAVFALRLKSGPKGDEVGRILISALTSVAMVTVVAHNSTQAEPIALRTVTTDGIEIRSLELGVLSSAGFRPAFALRDGYLVLASSPAVLSATQLSGGKTSPVVDGEIPVLRASLKALSRYLADRKEPLTAALAHEQGLSGEEFGRRLERLREVLNLFERLEISRRDGDKVVTWVARLHTARRLRP